MINYVPSYLQCAIKKYNLFYWFFGQPFSIRLTKIRTRTLEACVRKWAALVNNTSCCVYRQSESYQFFLRLHLNTCLTTWFLLHVRERSFITTRHSDFVILYPISRSVALALPPPPPHFTIFFYLPWFFYRYKIS